MRAARVICDKSEADPGIDRRGFNSRSARSTDSLELVARQWVAMTCAAQGISVEVAEPATLGRIATLLNVRPTTGVSLNSPADSDSAWIEEVTALQSRINGQMIDQSGDDCTLASGVELGPLAS